MEHLAGHVGLADEIEVALRDLLHFAGVADRQARRFGGVEGVAFGLAHAGPEVGLHDAGGHAVHPQGLQFHGERPGEPFHRPADARRRRPARAERPRPRRAGGEHQGAAVPDHPPPVLGGGKRAPVSQLEKSADLGQIGVQHQELQGLGRRVDEMVEGAHRLEKGLRRRLVRKVDRPPFGARSQGGDRRRHPSLGARADHDPGAFRRRRLGDREADAGRAAEHHDALFIQSHGRTPWVGRRKIPLA